MRQLSAHTIPHCVYFLALPLCRRELILCECVRAINLAGFKNHHHDIFADVESQAYCRSDEQPHAHSQCNNGGDLIYTLYSSTARAVVVCGSGQKINNRNAMRFHAAPRHIRHIHTRTHIDVDAENRLFGVQHFLSSSKFADSDVEQSRNREMFSADLCIRPIHHVASMRAHRCSGEGVRCCC